MLGRFVSALRDIFVPDPQSSRVVPPSGFTASLTVVAAGAMAFLAVFSLALSLAAGRLAERWGNELVRGATVRIVAPADQEEAQITAALRVLESTAGVANGNVQLAGADL